MAEETSGLRNYTFRSQDKSEPEPGPMWPRERRTVGVRDLATLAFVEAPLLETIRLEEVAPGYWRVFVASDAVAPVRAALQKWAPVGTIESVVVEVG